MKHSPNCRCESCEAWRRTVAAHAVNPPVIHGQSVPILDYRCRGSIMVPIGSVTDKMVKEQ